MPFSPLPALCLGAISRMTSAASSSDLPENMAESFRTDTGDDDFFLVIENSDALRRFCDDSTVVGAESCLSVEAGGRSLESASSTASPLREISGGGPNMETLRSLSRLGMLHNYLTDRPNVCIEHH